jgi:O-glycosyl hydrolase
MCLGASLAKAAHIKVNLRYIRILICICLASLLLSCQGTDTTQPLVTSAVNTIKINIDLNQKLQVIENFGVSGAWWAQEIGGWQEDNRQRIITLLFDIENGIGLSAYRYNIGAGGGGEIQDPWRRTDSFEVSPEEYDWKRDANAVRILRMVYEAGVDQLIAFSNSPPPRLTRSGMVSGGIGGSSNLGQNQESAYAKYLVDIVLHLLQVEMIPVQWLSPINEPQRDWSITNQQEGCHYTPEEAALLILTLKDYIHELNVDVKILAPESGRWAGSQDFWDAFQSNGRLDLDVFAVHSYSSTIDDKSNFAQYALGHQPNLRIWMTEWTEMQSGRDSGMDSAITLSQTIHDDLTNGGVTAWQYWIAVSKYDYRDGLIYVNPGNQIPVETKRLWAFGNFSRFIRPGSQRISSSVNQPKLAVSAYLAPDNNSMIIIVINPEGYPQKASFTLSGTNWLNYQAYETSANYDLTPIHKGVLTQEYTFHQRSVTTLVVTP